VILKAEEVMQLTVETYNLPIIDFSQSVRKAGGRRRCASGI
jgi:hypothetical protein